MPKWQLFFLTVNLDYAAKDYVNVLFLKVSSTVILEAPCTKNMILKKQWAHLQNRSTL